MSMFRMAGRIAAIGAAAGLVMAVGGLQAKPVTYKLPPDKSQFKPGPNLDLVKANCTGCHSADYVQTQPRGPKFGKDFWTAEVNKMIKVYGAPINADDIPKIVDYLAATYQ